MRLRVLVNLAPPEHGVSLEPIVPLATDAIADGCLAALLQPRESFVTFAGPRTIHRRCIHRPRSAGAHTAIHK